MNVQASGNPYITHPKDRAKSDELWEKFNVGEPSPERDDDGYVSTLIGDWSRCRQAGVNPVLQHADMLPKEEFERLLNTSRFLLDTAGPILDRVDQMLSGVPGILILGDKDGNVLKVVGDPRIRLRAANKSNLVEGAKFGETSAGINGIGTPLVKKAPVHIYSSEHFCEGWHMWTCAGAPIMDPFTGQVIGVIDFTTYEKDYRENALAFAYSIAVNVTSDIRLKKALEEAALLKRYEECFNKYQGDEIVLADSSGKILRASHGAAEDARGRPHGLILPVENRDIVVCVGEDPTGSLLLRRREKEEPRTFHLGSTSCEEVRTYGSFITRDPEMKQLMERIGKVARSDLGVLLIGETGTGKELIANYIHSESKRRAGPYIAVNCGAINKELFESTFFGYDRGAFTGADARGRKGLFDSANGGTLFLDEIGEMPLDIQAGLLRVLESRTFRRIGSDRELSTDCRIIAATNRQLLQQVQQGTFRSDLYYRLSVVKFDIPTLKNRPGDIPLLVDHLAKAACEKYGFPRKEVSGGAMERLCAHKWTGNVRELRNVVESACASSDRVIDLQDLPSELHQAGEEPEKGTVVAEPAPNGDFSLKNQEVRLILEVLRKYKKVSLVAETLGLSRATLYRRFKELGINHHDVVTQARAHRNQ